MIHANSNRGTKSSGERNLLAKAGLPCLRTPGSQEVTNKSQELGVQGEAL